MKTWCKDAEDYTHMSRRLAGDEPLVLPDKLPTPFQLGTDTGIAFESQAEINALCPISEADVSLVYAVQSLKERLFRAKVALWSCGILGLVELLHLLYH